MKLLQQQQEFGILSSPQNPAPRPSFCPLQGRNDTILNPYYQTGYTCFDNEGGSNNNTVKHIIGYKNGGFVEADCSNVNGKWEIFNCSSAEAFYRHEAETSDLEILKSWWSPKCCSTKEDIREYWREETREQREHSRISIIIKGVTGWISTIASSIFIWMLRRSHDGFATTQNRILLCLCISDLSFSMQFLTYGIMAPKALSYIAWNARGNMVTCQVDTFFVVLGSTGPGYTASLCLLYLAIVKYDKSDKYIRAKLEPFLLGVPVLILCGNYVFRFARGSLHPSASGSCTDFVYKPPHCQNMEEGFVIEGLFGNIPCGSDEIAKIVQVLRGRGFLFVLVLPIAIVLPIVIIMASLAIIYREVLLRENGMSKYGTTSILKKKAAGVNRSNTMSNDEDVSAASGIWGRLNQYFTSHSSSFKKDKSTITPQVKQNGRSKLSGSRLVLYRGLAYSCSWLLSWGPYFIGFFVAGKDASIYLVYLVSLSLPFQGFFNLAIYMLPKILSAKRSKRENLSLRQAIVKAFWSKGTKSRKRGEQTMPRPSRARYRSDEKNKQKGSDKNQKPENRVPQDVTHLSFGRRSTSTYRHSNVASPTGPVNVPVAQNTSLNKKDEVVVKDCHSISDEHADENDHVATRRTSNSLLSFRSEIKIESSNIGISYATEDGFESC